MAMGKNGKGGEGMEQGLISVVVPVYNGENVVESCLKTVLSQDVPLEIVVVNDGSQDGTLALLQRMAQEDSRIRVFTQENAGVAAARNRALRECRGEYIRFVDADDLVPQGSMAALLSAARANESDLVIAGYLETMGKKTTPRGLKKQNVDVPTDEMLSHMNRWSNSFYYGALWNKLFRRDIIQEHNLQFIGGMKWGEDFCFVCQYLQYADWVRYCSDLVYEYRRTASGMTVKQCLDCVVHPLENCKKKVFLYRQLKNLYVHRGQYGNHRKTLWQYLFRVTLNN